MTFFSLTVLSEIFATKVNYFGRKIQNRKEMNEVGHEDVQELRTEGKRDERNFLKGKNSRTHKNNEQKFLSNLNLTFKNSPWHSHKNVDVGKR